MMTSEDWALPMLQEVRKLDPNACIAGGYLRDMDNNRPVKDVDVFMSKLSEAYSVEQVIKRTHPDMVGSCDSAYENSTSGVAFAWTYEGDGLPSLNLIGLNKCKTPEEVLETFDFGLCRIGYAGDVIYTDGYKADKEGKTFTLLRADDRQQFERSLDRYARLSEKYPGWSLVIPDKLKRLVKRMTVDEEALF